MTRTLTREGEGLKRTILQLYVLPAVNSVSSFSCWSESESSSAASDDEAEDEEAAAEETSTNLSSGS